MRAVAKWAVFGLLALAQPRFTIVLRFENMRHKGGAIM